MNSCCEFLCARCGRTAKFNDGVHYWHAMRVCVHCYCELPDDRETGADWPDITDAQGSDAPDGLTA